MFAHSFLRGVWSAWVASALLALPSCSAPGQSAAPEIAPEPHVPKGSTATGAEEANEGEPPAPPPPLASGAAAEASTTSLPLVLGPAPPDPDFAGLAASDLESLEAGVQRWLVAEGADRGKTLLRTLAVTDRFGAAISERWGERSTHFLRPSSDGGVEMTATTAHEDKATTLFDPPLRMAPPLLVPGSPFTARSRMRVVDESDPSRLRHLGRCERTLTIVGRDLVRTPLGEMVAVRVTVEFRATLQLATAVDTATVHVVPGRGMVAEERTERIRAVGIVNRTRQSTVVREE